MAQTVIGIFDNATEAQKAVEKLVSSGFPRSNIDISTKSMAQNRNSNEDHDSVGGFFSSLFDSKDEVSNYSTMAKQGSVVTVHAQSMQEAELAADILDEYGAVDVNERAIQYGSNTARDTAQTGTSIPIIEEELQVGKRVVETGRVRLRSRIIERPVKEHLRLREEQVHVERQAVNRPASESDLETFKEGIIEITEHAEVPVISKEVRVVEEVSLSKDVEEREEIIRDTVRKTDVDVEEIKPGSAQTFTGKKDQEAEDFLDKSQQDMSNLVRLENMDDYTVAEDDPDVRGWDVVDSMGEKIGEVYELIVDTDAMKVRYLDVELDDEVSNEADNHILIPIGVATLNRDDDHVVIPNLDRSTLSNYPPYKGQKVSREYEQMLLSTLSPDYKSTTDRTKDFYENNHFDDSRFYSSRK